MCLLSPLRPQTSPPAQDQLQPSKHGPGQQRSWICHFNHGHPHRWEIWLTYASNDTCRADGKGHWFLFRLSFLPESWYVLMFNLLSQAITIYTRYGNEWGCFDRNAWELSYSPSYYCDFLSNWLLSWIVSKNRCSTRFDI